MAAQVRASSLFVDVAACGDLDEVKRLLGDGTLPAECINAIDKDGRSAFHYACLNDDAPLLRVLLADARVDVLLTSPRGETGLHMAALYAAQEALKLLFADGRCDVDAVNNFGETPLHLCAGSGDKSSAKAAGLLLDAGASLLLLDQWKRGPKDVSHQNAENALVEVFETFLADKADLKSRVEAASAALKAHNEKPVYNDAANTVAKKNIFGALGGVKLRKTTTVEKHMFKPGENKGGGSSSTMASDGRKALSKLVDFPGDLEAITAQLADASTVDPAAADAFGLTALHKFASWNKGEYLDLLLPKLTADDLNRPDPYGKTALHWAVEMASVAAVKALVKAGADTSARDAKGRTVAEILVRSPVLALF